MNTEDSPELSLFNICGGAADERFRREVALIMENWIDPNTDPEVKRIVTMEFSFLPFKDRTGAEVTLVVKSKVAPAESVSGTVFVTRRHSEIVAVPFDPKQERLFSEEEKKECK